MFILGLISSDAPLCHAIGEQLKQLEAAWPHAKFQTLESALAAWSDALPPMILWDCETAPASRELVDFLIMRLSKEHPSPLVLVIGNSPAELDAIGVTERFGRPLRLGHLLMRLQFYHTVLQRAPSPALQVGPWLFSVQERSLKSDSGQETVRLTDKEASLLEYLCSADGVVLRDELLTAVWGYGAGVDTHTLETHIYRLRKKLVAKADNDLDPILSEAGGYRINPQWSETNAS